MLTAVVLWGILLSFSIYRVSPNNFLSFLNLLRLLLGMETKINYSYSEALLFVWPNGCFPQVKPRKTKENGISHLRWKRPSFIRQGKSLHQSQPSYRVFQKNCWKRGTQITSWAHIYVAFSIIWTGNQQCSVPHTDKTFNIIITFHPKSGCG